MIIIYFILGQFKSKNSKDKSKLEKNYIDASSELFNKTRPKETKKVTARSCHSTEPQSRNQSEMF